MFKLIFTDPVESRLTRWKVREGSRYGEKIVLCEYKNSKLNKLKSEFAGTVTKILIKENEIVHNGDVLALLERCPHSTLWRNMCADCGTDLKEEQNVTSSAFVAMEHSIPDLLVSEKSAQELGKEDEKRLLKSRRLVLLVDLDQTIIHTTNDNIPSNLKDVYHFQLNHGPNNQLWWYHTKFRPYTQRFLENVSKYYELHICTFGVRTYAHAIANLLDPDKKYFQHRILSRDECFHASLKTLNLKALFPCGDSMVCIIDDREDVWGSAPNMIRVKPYMFFQGTADINAPPGASKTSPDRRTKYSPIARKEKIIKVPISEDGCDEEKKDECDGSTGDVIKNDEACDNVDKQGGGGDCKRDGDNIDEVVKCDVASDDNIKCDDDVSKPGDDVKKADDDVRDDVRDDIKDDKEDDNDGKEDNNNDKEDDDKEDNDDEINENISKTKDKEKLNDKRDDNDNNIKRDDDDDHNIKHDDDDSNIKRNDDDHNKRDDDDDNHNIKHDNDDNKDDETALDDGVKNSNNNNIKDILKDDNNNKDIDCSSNENQPTTNGSPDLTDENKDTKVEDISKKSSKSSKNLSQSMPEQKTKDNAKDKTKCLYREIIEWEDEDDYLLHLETILLRIHEQYYKLYDSDSKAKDENSPNLDLKELIPEEKKKILKGCNILFSGVVPMKQSIETSWMYALAMNYGASVHKHLVEGPNGTTHVVAVRDGTEKIKKALALGIHVVSVNWLLQCTERWEKVDEKLFPVKNVESLPFKYSQAPPEDRKSSSKSKVKTVEAPVKKETLTESEKDIMLEEIDDDLSDTSSGSSSSENDLDEEISTNIEKQIISMVRPDTSKGENNNTSNSSNFNNSNNNNHDDKDNVVEEDEDVEYETSKRKLLAFFNDESSSSEDYDNDYSRDWKSRKRCKLDDKGDADDESDSSAPFPEDISDSNSEDSSADDATL